MSDYPNVPTYLFACAPLIERAALSVIVTTPPELGGTLEALVKPFFELGAPTWFELRYTAFLASYDISRFELDIDGDLLVVVVIGSVFADALNFGFDTGAVNLSSPRPLLVTGFGG